jgi:hypothetical protein
MPKLGAVLAIDSDVTVIEAALIACLIAVFIIVVFQLVGTTSATCSPRLATSSSERERPSAGSRSIWIRDFTQRGRARKMATRPSSTGPRHDPKRDRTAAFAPQPARRNGCRSIRRKRSRGEAEIDPPFSPAARNGTDPSADFSSRSSPVDILTRSMRG